TWDIAQQQPFIDAAVQTHPQGIVLAPTDSKALITQVKGLVDGGTPVVTVDAALDEPVDIQSIQSNHYLGGVAAGEALAKVAEAGKKGQIKLIAFDAAPQQVRDLKDGVYDALIVQEPYNMGYDSVKLVAALVRKQVDKAAVKHDNLMPFTIATRDNLGDPAVAR